MYKTSYVAAIDDNKLELEILCEALWTSGILCRPIHYNPATPMIPEFPLLRLLFLDLNLAHSTDAKLQAQTISDVLRRLKPLGPYIIIVWSQTPGNIVTIRKRLAQGHADLLPPVTIDTLDKSNYLPPPGTTSPPFTGKLKKDITAIIDRSPIIKALLQWEARVAMAAGRSLNGLLKLAMNGRSWTTATPGDQDLAKLLGSVSCAAAGPRRAKADVARAIEEGLLPLIEDQLATLETEPTYSDLWNKAVPADCIPRHPAGNPVDAAGMNRHYLIEERDGFAKTDRGVWVKLADAHATDDGIKKLFGFANKNALLGEFLEVPSRFKTLKLKIKTEVRIGLLEIGAECDHAQGKVGLYRFALCVLIPAEFKKYTYFSRKNTKDKRETKNQAIQRLPPLKISKTEMISETEMIVKIHFRYVMGLTANSEILGEPLFRVRRQILNEITYRCAQHLARPGIVAF